jgi:hypothetical protein
MSFVKDETTVRLDALHREGMEAIGTFEDLEERIDDVDLRGLVAAHAAAQRTLLERTADLRRAAGEMPHAGDPERSHLEAAGAFVRAVLLPGETSSHYVESLIDTALRVEKLLDDALALDLAAELRRALESFRADNSVFLSELHKRL